MISCVSACVLSLVQAVLGELFERRMAYHEGAMKQDIRTELRVTIAGMIGSSRQEVT